MEENKVISPEQIEAEKLLNKHLKRVQAIDTCFGNTQEQFDECQKLCTGHGCPHWITFAKESAIGECQSIIDEHTELEKELLRNVLGYSSEFVKDRIIYWETVIQEIVNY